MNKIDFEYSQLGDLILTSNIVLPICLYKNLKPNELIVYKLYLLYQKKCWRCSCSSFSSVSGLSRKTIRKNNDALIEEGYITSYNKIDKSVKKMMEEAYKNELVYSPYFLFQGDLLPSESEVVDIILYLFEKKEGLLVAKDILQYVRISERQVKDILKKLKERNLICGKRGFYPNVTELISLSKKIAALKNNKNNEDNEK